MATSLDIHTDLSTVSIIGPWSCNICQSKDGDVDHPVCASCQQILEISKNDASTDDTKVAWQCPRCTLYNSNDHEKCNACGASKFVLNVSEKVLIKLAVALPQAIGSMNVRTRRHKDETNAEHIFQNIVQYCQKDKTNFIDDQFLHEERSIGLCARVKVVRWLRIADVASSSHHDNKLELKMFSSPQPSDIQQGALGNCWLVAALALVSERPRLLEHILLTKTINREGVYLVRICHNGLWQPIIVDDYFPCTAHKHLVFTQAKRRQLYVPLIEKACAKVFGSYANLTSGNMLEGLQLLTGAPCDHIDLQPTNHSFDEDLVWAQLLSAFQANLLIGASSGRHGVSLEEYARVHINPNHAFSLLAAHTLITNPHRFVLVRDPHSHSSYSEDVITGNVLQQLRAFKATDRSTGDFWITWPKFLRYFSSITISNYNSDYNEIRERGTFTRSPTDSVTSYRLTVSQPSMTYISLLYHRKNRRTHSYHTQAFVLCDVDELKKSNSIGKRESILIGRRGGFTYWSGRLKPGNYFLIPFSTSFWKNDEKHRDFTIVIQSSSDFQFTIKNKPSTFLADCLIAATMKVGHNDSQDHKAKFYKTSSKLGMKIFIAENLSETKYLNVDINVITATNVRHSRHAHLPYHTHDCIPPRYRQILFITEWADKRNQICQLNYNYSRVHDTKKSDSKPWIDVNHDDLHSPRPF